MSIWRSIEKFQQETRVHVGKYNVLVVSAKECSINDEALPPQKEKRNVKNDFGNRNNKTRDPSESISHTCMER